MDGQQVAGHHRMPGVKAGVVVMVMIASGCTPAGAPQPVTPATTPSVVVTPVSIPTVGDSTKPTTPAIKQRSAESLRDRIRATVERMDADALPRRRRTSLQRVARAFLDHRMQQGAFPKDAESGLSWRVALLPFLGEERLHGQFHHDEPWDSPHNNNLLARMPQVFGDDALGLTRLHQWADPLGAVMVVDLPEDAAEFWTKPEEIGHSSVVVPELIAFQDGTIAVVQAGVTVNQWQQWQGSSPSSDSLPAWLDRVAVRTDRLMILPGGAASVDAKGAAPMPLPAGTWCAVNLSPRRLMSHPLRAELFRAVLADTEGTRGPLGAFAPQLREAVGWLKQRGMELEQLESLQVVVPAKLFDPRQNANESFAVVCQAAGIFHVEAMIEAEMQLSPTCQYREQGASAGLVDLKRFLALQFADERTLLIGGQGLVRSLSEAQPKDSHLTGYITAAGASSVVLVVDAEPLQQMLQRQPVAFPPPLQELLPFVLDAKHAVVTFDPDAESLATLTLHFRQSSSVTGLQALLSRHVEGLRTRDVSPATPWIAALDANLRFEADNEILRVVVTRPDDMDALVQTLLKASP